MGIGDMLFYSFVVYPVINWLSSPQRKYSYTRRIIYSMSFLLILVGYQISQSSLVQKNLYGVMNVTQEDFRPKWVIPTTTTANATTNTPVGKIDEVTKDDIKLSQTLSSPPPVDAALRKSYKRMLLKYHPDKQPQGTSPEVLAENEVQFHAIKNAYDVLINNHKRAVYNVFGEAAVSTLFTQSSTSSSKSSNSDSSHKNKANGKKSKRGKGGSKGGGLNGSGVNRKEHGQFKRMMLLQLFAYYGSTFIYTFFTTINDTNSSVSSQGCYFGLLCMFCFELFCYFYCDPLMMVVVPYKRIVGDSSVGDAIIHVSGASMSEPVLLVKYCFRYLTNILAPTLTLHEVCEGLKLLYPVYMNGFCRCLLIQLTAYEPSQTLSPLSPNKNSIKSATAGDQKQSQQQRKQPEPQPQPQPQ